MVQFEDLVGKIVAHVEVQRDMMIESYLPHQKVKSMKCIMSRIAVKV